MRAGIGGFRPNLVMVSGIVTAVIAGLIATIAWTAPMAQFDAGITSSAATFTVHGLWPYRDYWLLYGPLSGWAFALPLGLVGPSVELLRFAGLIVVMAQAFVAFRLASRWLDGFGAAILAIAAVLPPVAFLGLDLTSWALAMLLALIALDARLVGRSSFLVGALVGLTFWARLDVGGYLLLSLLMNPDRRRLLLGFAALVVPLGLMAVTTTAFGSLIEQLIWYPLVGMRQFRVLPGLEAVMPGSMAAILTVPLAVVPRLALLVAAVHAIRSDTGRTSWPIIGFAALCQLQAAGRADAAHFALASTPALLVLATWSIRPRVLARTALTVVVATTFAGTAIGLATGVVADRSSDDALRRAVRVVRSVTDRDDPIFVGLTSNRYTLLNPMVAYYLADRRPGTRITMYNPGISNTDRVQRSMVAELEATQTDFLILNRDWAMTFEAQNDSRLAGSDVLDRYIAADFRLWCDFQHVIVSVRATRSDVGTCADPEGQISYPSAGSVDGT